MAYLARGQTGIEQQGLFRLTAMVFAHTRQESLASSYAHAFNRKNMESIVACPPAQAPGWQCPTVWIESIHTNRSRATQIDFRVIFICFRGEKTDRTWGKGQTVLNYAKNVELRAPNRTTRCVQFGGPVTVDYTKRSIHISFDFIGKKKCTWSPFQQKVELTTMAVHYIFKYCEET